MYLIGGDWSFFWPENLSNFWGLPQAWDSVLNTGIGTPALQLLWINSYLNFTSNFSRLGLSWNTISIIFWFLPILIIGFLSATYLFRYVFPQQKYLSWLAGFIYIFNSYFLLIFSGGQMGVAFGYSILPLVLLRFFKLLDSLDSFNSIFFALSFSLLLLFDIRFAYIAILLCLFFLLTDGRKLFLSKKFFLYILLSAFIIILIHSFWILPVILFPMPIGVGGGDLLKEAKFFSFGNFSNGISLLHPNWPENIFGKVYFLKPEFLIIPIIAFSSLLFNQKQSRSWVLKFAFIALVGIFLTKGINDPFGLVYSWSLIHIPGFLLFRDPTKFFILISIAYALLIPFAIACFCQKYKSSSFLAKSIILVFIIIWLITLRQFPFKKILPKSIPQEYVALKNFIVTQPEFFRTLWMPARHKFAFFSFTHPASYQTELPTMDKNTLNEFDTKYVIIPSYTGEEIALNDKTYSKKIYQQYVSSMKKIPYLHQVKQFGNIIVFATDFPINDHIYIKGKGSVSYSMQSQTSYKLTLHNISKGDNLIFSEASNPYWVLKLPEKVVHVQKKGKIMQFPLEKGSYNAEVYYLPQRFVDIGLGISAITILVSIISIIILLRKK